MSSLEHQHDPDYESPRERQEHWIRQLATRIDHPTTQEEFIKAHTKKQMDTRLGDLFDNAWLSYNSLAAQTPVDPSTGMSVFDLLGEPALRPRTDGEGNMEIPDADNDNDSVISEEVSRPPYDHRLPFDGNHQYLPEAAKTSPAQENTAYYIHNYAAHQAAMTRELSGLNQAMDGKFDLLISLVTAMSTEISSLKHTCASLQRQINIQPQQQKTPTGPHTAINKPNNNNDNNQKHPPPPINNNTRPQH